MKYGKRGSGDLSCAKLRGMIIKIQGKFFAFTTGFFSLFFSSITGTKGVRGGGGGKKSLYML